MSVVSAPNHSPRIWYARGMVFLSGFCLMVIEMVASRVLAPAVGVSLFTWTGVIGVMLLGYTVGSIVGGHVADRYASLLWLGGSMASGGLCAILFLALIAPSLGGLLAATSLPVWILVLLFCVLIFFPASFFLSMVPPQLVKFALQDVKQTGSVVGSIGSWNAAGSILGTYLAGFVLIQYLPTTTIILIVGGILILTGFVIMAMKSLATKYV